MTTKLTGWAKQIAIAIKCDDKTAEKIFDLMCESGFDFSEASNAKFKRECKISLAVINQI